MSFHTPVFAPSILSADFGNLAQEVRDVLVSGSQVIHFDVMDNNFVPNLTIGPLVLASLRKNGITAPIDVHLMVNDETRLIDDFAEAGASMISFHPHASKNPDQSLKKIKSHGCLAGLAVNPDQSADIVEPYLDDLDFILLMSVYPGFAGQKFIPKALDNCREVKKLIGSRSILIEMDGGIGMSTILDASNAGVDIFVMGSAIFNHREKNNPLPYQSIISKLNKKITDKTDDSQ